MGTIRLYMKEDYAYAREYYYQVSDKDFLESVRDFTESYKADYGEDFTPENLLSVFKLESELFDIHKIISDLKDYHGTLDSFFGPFTEWYSDSPDFEVETDPEFVKDLFRRGGVDLTD